MRDSRAEPLVTVVIPTHNMGHLLTDAVNSVLAQTGGHFQIVIVDDGSTDNTSEVAAQWSDARILYLYQENAGLSAARNAGLREARGNFICFLDADDLLLPSKTATQLAFLAANPTFAGVAGGAIRSDETGRVLYRHARQPGVISQQSLYVANQTPVHALLFRTSWVRRVGEFDETLRGAEDWDFLCRLSLADGAIGTMRDIVCDYRIFAGSMSANPRRQTDALERVVEKTFNHPAMPIELAPLRTSALGEAWFAGARKAWLAMDADAFREYLARAVQALPRLAADPVKTVEYFPYSGRHLSPDELATRHEFFLSHLPPAAEFLRHAARQWDFLTAKDRVFTSFEAGRRCEAIGGAASLLLQHPVATCGYYLRRVSR